MTTFALQLDEPTALPDARRKLRTWLRHVPCRVECAANAELVASELLTNAVQHAAPPVALHAELHDDCVHLEVRDDLPEPPALRFPPGPRGAFGLHIVHAMSLDWGWEVQPAGKVIWADVEL